MGYSPGNALIIDEKLHLLENQRPSGPDGIQYDGLKFIGDYFKNENIPTYFIGNGFENALTVIERIDNLQNVRFVVLDLALTGEEPSETDEDLLILIIRKLVSKFGYFFLFINSAHLEFWSGVRAKIVSSETDNSNSGSEKEKTNLISATFLDNIIIELNKNNLHELKERVKAAPVSKFSLNILYIFESELNRARDEAFGSFLDFDTQSWEAIFQILTYESGNMSNFDLVNIFLNFLRQRLIKVNFPLPPEDNPQNDPELLKKIFSELNYLKFGREYTVWTGNLYQTTEGSSSSKKYAVVITPECDLAQKKHLKYCVVYGFEINEDTFPLTYRNDTSVDNTPLLVSRAGKNSKGKWKSYDVINKNGLPEHLYVLPFASKAGRSIVLDFRDTESLEYIPVYWYLQFRINDPMITELLDHFSGLFNRKGQIGFPLPKQLV